MSASVGGERRQARLSNAGEGIAGAFAGAFSRLLVSPLDVLKIHFQLQMDPVLRHAEGAPAPGARALPSSAPSSAMPYYRSMRQASSSIVAAGGIAALWRGALPATVLWAAYMAIQFPAYRAAAQALGGLPLPGEAARDGRPPLALALLAGGVSGAAATGLTYPLDWLRTRMAAEAYRPAQQRPSALHIVSSSLRSGGVAAAFAGLSPTLLQVVPSLAVTFATYEQTSTLFDSAVCVYRVGDSDSAPCADPRVRSLVAGGIAGVLGKFAVYPLDTVKKRLQMQSRAGAAVAGGRTYTGTLDALLRIGREEGIRGLFKGTAPSLLKAGAGAAFAFASYESAGTWLREYAAWAVVRREA
jgi:solute carrier family 25 thiamine pyrophosphate transporter 19